MRIEVNQREAGGTIAAGTYFDMQFDKFQVFTPAFERLRISGGVRIDYVTAFDTNTRRGTLTYRSRGLSTNHDGTILEASDGVLTVHYGDGTVVAETTTERFVDLKASTTSDADGTVSGGAISTNFGDGFIDIRHAAWTVAAGVPQPGAVASIAGGGGSAATVTVQSATGLAANCLVTVTSAGQSREFIVDIAIAR
jgi:hypothetical protein